MHREKNTFALADDFINRCTPRAKQVCTSVAGTKLGIWRSKKNDKKTFSPVYMHTYICIVTQSETKIRVEIEQVVYSRIF